ncbi:hypothetical protein RRF57_003234 [Xylaria bambusicola]|uniref:SGNH hydrolase-type esterase domain-containing protein n=1 Tax=Xylaria bambusicola TaxID=326684 RepID=A0AAN7UEF6_9PEZI
MVGDAPDKFMPLSSSVITSTRNARSIYNVQGPLAGGILLRIMFMGASVTRGAVSIGNLGVCYPLRTKLAALGNPINLIRSQRLGASKDNDLETYTGNRINQIREHATQSVLQLRPNVFVIHVGSNDCLQKHDTAHAQGGMILIS